MPRQSDENHDFTSSLKLLLNLYKWAISSNSFLLQMSQMTETATPPERWENHLLPYFWSLLHSKKEKKVDIDVTIFFVYVFACVCAGWDWEAAEKASPQSDFPGWRSVLHQQETERRMAQPLEDGGGRETGICIYSNMEAVLSLESDQTFWGIMMFHTNSPLDYIWILE